MDFTDELVLERFPLAPIDRDNVEYYRGLLKRRLLVNRCQDCGTWHHPPFPVCPHCWSDRLLPTEVGGTGHVYLATTLYVGPESEGVDYSSGHALVSVELPEQPGLRVTAPIVSCAAGDVQLGMSVRLTWIDRCGTPAVAFEPAPG